MSTNKTAEEVQLMSRKVCVQLVREVNKLYRLEKDDAGFIRPLKSDTEETLKEKLIERLTLLTETDSEPLLNNASDALSGFIIENGIVGDVDEEEEEEEEGEEEEEDEEEEEEEDEEEDDDGDEEEEDDDDEVADAEEEDDEPGGSEIEDPSESISLSTIASMIEVGINKILEAIQASGVATRQPRKPKGPVLSDEDQAEFDLKMDAAKQKALRVVKGLFVKHTTLDEIIALAAQRKVETKSSTLTGIKAAIRGATMRRAQAKVKKEFAASV